MRLILLDLSKEYQRLGGSIKTCNPLMAYPCPPFRADPHLRFSLGHDFPFSFELATIDLSRSRIPVSNRKAAVEEAFSTVTLLLASIGDMRRNGEVSPSNHIPP